MHSRSRHVLPRLRESIGTRAATIATKPAPLPTRNTATPPSTLSSNRPPPNLSKWERPEVLPQRFPGFGSSSSRTAPSTRNLRERRSRGPAGEDQQGRYNHRPDRSRTAFSGQSKWKRDIPFPMPAAAGSDRFSRDSAPHQSKSVAPPFPSPRTAARTGRVTHDPPVLTENVRFTSEELFDDGRNFESDVSISGYARESLRESKGRRLKIGHKERGSLKRAFWDDGLPSRNHDRDTPATQISKPKGKLKTLNKTQVEVFIPSTVSVGNLARILKVPLGRLQRRMREAGMADEASYDHVLTSEYAVLLAHEFNRNPVINDEAAFDIYPPPPPVDASTLPLRPPIVTIMGHVDHGKTTLLDTLRSASVAKGEAGGITQHIGAFSVSVPNTVGGGLQNITFLDTPGHAAFSAMRARGADVTDIVVLVVAADDGVRPQTKEVIQLVQKDPNVQLIVAINKIDKPGIKISNVHNALLVEGVQLEALGGDIPSVEISGLTGQGLDQLMETITAVAEMQDLRAAHEGPACGRIIESKLQKGLGHVATVLLLRGSLKLGAHLIAGTTQAKVRVMTDSTGSPVKVAIPGMAVTVSGWKELPGAGDEVLEGSEHDVKKAVANRLRKAEEQAMMIDIDAINTQRRLEREQKEREEADQPGMTPEAEEEAMKPRELRLIIKGDVSGSVEALVGAVQYIGNEKARVKIVCTGVGEITESDITLAKTSGSMIVAFSVPVPRSATLAAGMHSIPIFSSKVIYQVVEDIRERVTNLLPAVYEKRISGEADVLQIFDIKLSGRRTKAIAGCRVTKGIIEKNKKVQVVRDGEVIHEGRLDTFKHMKTDITNASKGTECGVSLESFVDLRKDDVIQVYSDIELPKVL